MDSADFERTMARVLYGGEGQERAILQAIVVSALETVC